MSTSAFITVEGSTIALYKHYDGDPESTLPWLQAFHTKFLDERGNDVPYEMAQLVRSSVSLSPEFNLDDNTATGWGLYPMVDGELPYELDFTYILKADGSVNVINNFGE